MDTKVTDTNHFEDVVKHRNREGELDDNNRVLVSRMEEALAQENPKALRKSFLRLYACIFVAYLCCATNGFDANTFGNVTSPLYVPELTFSSGGLSAMPGFVSYFGINKNNQGLVAALYVIGNVAGSFVAGPCSDKYGRRAGMAIGSVICVIGAVAQTAAQNLSALEAGRFVLGIGAVIVQTAGPSYVVEIAYPKYRGQLTGGYQACFFLGTIISTWLEYGLYFCKTSSSFVWRVPLAVQATPSLAILCCVWMIPESPRWQVSPKKNGPVSLI